MNVSPVDAKYQANTKWVYQQQFDTADLCYFLTRCDLYPYIVSVSNLIPKIKNTFLNDALNIDSLPESCLTFEKKNLVT